MKFFLKALKWIGLLMGSLLLLIILAGLTFRLFSPEAHQPMGELVDVGGFKMHINASGEKSSKPTLVIEAGTGLASMYYHWLNEGLKDSLRVVRYDRAGLGYSELSNTPRDPETIARELHTLLEKAGESPPYILAGHSFGGPYIRVFADLYPKEVVAMAFLDSTHPDQAERFGAPPASSIKFKSVIGIMSIAKLLTNLGVTSLFESLNGPIYSAEGLPDELNNRTKDFLMNGKCMGTYIQELKNYHAALKRAGAANEFGSLPIRIFTAAEIDKNVSQEKLIAAEQRLATTISRQKEFTALSTNAKQLLIDGNHATIFTKKENADIICKEILQLLGELKY